NLSCDDTSLITRDLSCPNERCPISSSSIPNTDIYHVQGQWGTWSLWTACTVTCGSGIKQRSRACNIPNRCIGAATERETCNTHVCPTIPSTEPQWTDWTSWNQCSVSCGIGSQARYRKCATSQNTIAYTCAGKTMDIRNCEELPCNNVISNSIAGMWATWQSWSTCSESCGPGIQTRQRYCLKEPCDGSGMQRMACNLKECAQWGQWGGWSQCSRLCGKGLMSRSRACPIPNACPGSSIEQSFCALAIGQWSGWSAWGQCSQTCGAGIKRRTRHCQGGNCPGNLRESIVCNLGTCGTTTANWGGEDDSTTTTTSTTNVGIITTIGSGVTNHISTVSVIGIESSTTTTTTTSQPFITTTVQPTTTTQASSTTTTSTIFPSTTPEMEWRLLPRDSSQDSVLRWTLMPKSKDDLLSPNSRFQYFNGKGISSARSVSQNEARQLRLRF
uniref:Uncharacterized protein n=1 Tax=Panagrolaimus sp. JU765 TaxID=591449 RepID=A0AC34R7M1_9BILA